MPPRTVAASSSPPHALPVACPRRAPSPHNDVLAPSLPASSHFAASSPVATPNTNFSSTLLPPKTPSTANRTRQTDTLPAAADRVWGLADRHQNPVSPVSRVSPVSPLKSLLVVPVTRPERPYLR
ncbi:hypothetical protein V500_00212 [Pseudogymnoascus sp. VKM F-4518 (FW-2643)]|nr:hypothetical protein V500_00212 [Pseudogymnoascus sp. VKM F-4518 (FW-2643)]